MASRVTRFSQRSPDIRIIGSSFLLPGYGAATSCPVSGPAAAIGLRPSSVRSIRTIRAARSTWNSVHTTPTAAGGTAPGTTAVPSVLSQNKIKDGSAVRCSEASKSWGCKASAWHPRQNLGESLVHLLAVKSRKGGQYSCVLPCCPRRNGGLQCNQNRGLQPRVPLGSCTARRWGNCRDTLTLRG